MRHLVITKSIQGFDVEAVPTKQEARSIAKDRSKGSTICLVIGAVGLEHYETGKRGPADWSVIQGGKESPIKNEKEIEP